MHAPCDSRQAFRSVINGVHAGHYRQQYLRSANVRGRLFTANVLLARLQREAVGGLPLRIDRHTHQSARHRALERILAREKSGVRSTKAERHAEALRVAHDDVGVPCPRRFEQRQREQIGSDAKQCAFVMRLANQRTHVVNQAGGRCILREHAEVFIALHQLRDEPNLDVDTERLGARLHHLDRLRMTVFGDQNYAALALRAALCERHRFAGGGRLVEQRRIGDLHAGQIRHHRLKIEQCFEAALRNLGLIRRVGGVPGRVLENVAQDHFRRMRAVVALPDKAAIHLVLTRDRPNLRQRLFFIDRNRQCKRRTELDGRRHDGIDQRIERSCADDGEHLGDLSVVRPDVPRMKIVMSFEFGQRRHGAISQRRHWPGISLRSANRRSALSSSS